MSGSQGHARMIAHLRPLTLVITIRVAEECTVNSPLETEFQFDTLKKFRA